ncbi:RNA ligase family protein [Vibrio fortis]|uniref:RNA ligase family protein n=1 Tax=Vibrio fortis TaxID=212667 RepID=UPI00406763ED
MQRYKHPSILHHHTSPGVQKDDKILPMIKLEKLYGREYLASIKLDGENTTAYPDSYVHPRSVEYSYHPARTRMKALAQQIGYLFPSDLNRLSLEDCYARHSISYDNLIAHQNIFNAWDHDNNAMHWDRVEEISNLFNIPTAPVVWRGKLTEDIIVKLTSMVDTERCEGLVFRPVDGFAYENTGNETFKWVREGHVQTDKNWMRQQVIPNELKTYPTMDDGYAEFTEFCGFTKEKMETINA